MVASRTILDCFNLRVVKAQIQASYAVPGDQGALRRFLGAGSR